MMHENSIKTYGEEKVRLSKRAVTIYDTFKANPHLQFTDRMILKKLSQTDPNYVRPRITELIKAGLLIECGKVNCHETGKTVRVVKLPSTNPQQELF